VKALDTLYWSILQSGLINIRTAAEQGDLARCRAEADHIHNIPSLIGEENWYRHFYYADQERRAYIQWLVSSGRNELREHALLVFGTPWREMDRILRIRESSSIQALLGETPPE
jgi:hypothetical protein